MSEREPAPITVETAESVPTYSRGESVRVYVDDGEGNKVSEDDWEYRGYRDETGEEIAAKNYPEGGLTRFEKTEKSEFDSWQIERMAEAAGRLAAAANVDTPPEVDKVIDSESAEELDERPSWGSFNERGEYELTADPDELARTIDVPASVIRAAAERGFPPEFLLSAKTNGFSAERLRKSGIDFGAPVTEVGDGARVGYRGEPVPKWRTDKETGKLVPLEKLTPEEREDLLSRLDEYISTASDPTFKQAARGTKRKLEVISTADRIETEPTKVKHELRRPSRIPVIGKLLLARAVHRQEVRTGTAIIAEDGVLRLGIPRTRKHLSDIRRHDENIRVLRNKLRGFNNPQYRGPERASDRRDLAELIERAKRQQAAYDARRALPSDVYVHKPVKEELDNFNKSKTG